MGVHVQKVPFIGNWLIVLLFDTHLTSVAKIWSQECAVGKNYSTTAGTQSIWYRRMRSYGQLIDENIERFPSISPHTHRTKHIHLLVHPTVVCAVFGTVGSVTVHTECLEWTSKYDPSRRHHSNTLSPIPQCWWRSSTNLSPSVLGKMVLFVSISHPLGTTFGIVLHRIDTICNTCLLVELWCHPFTAHDGTGLIYGPGDTKNWFINRIHWYRISWWMWCWLLRYVECVGAKSAPGSNGEWIKSCFYWKLPNLL